MEWALIAALIISASVGGYGVYTQKQAADTAAEAAEAQGAHDAAVARNQAEQERLNRLAAERKERRDKRLRTAAIESMYAKSGVLMTGTPSDWLVAQAGVDEWNTQQGNLESRQKQLNLLDRASVIRAQANNEAYGYHMQGKAAMIQGFSQIGMSLVQGGMLMQGRSGGGGSR